MCADGFQNIVMSTMWALGSRIQLMACSRQCWFARLPSPLRQRLGNNLADATAEARRFLQEVQSD